MGVGGKVEVAEPQVRGSGMTDPGSPRPSPDAGTVPIHTGL